jgi:competence ComEA-like helix-hairpin-helix protein
MRRTAVLFVLIAVAQAQDLPAGKGKDLVEDRCSSCHGLDLLLAEHDSKAQWSQIVNEMVSRGATGSAEELATIVDYLAANFGPEVTKINVNTAALEDLQSSLMLSAPEAAAIVQYRKDHGKIKDWAALSKIPGIDSKKLESHKDRIVFE